MDTAIFFVLHSLIGFSPIIDAAVIFAADYLAFLLFFALVGYESWQWVVGRRSRARALLGAIGIAGFAWLVAEAVKFFIARPRPFLVIDGLRPLIQHGGYDSFPSGHVTFFFALGVAFLFAKKQALSILFMSTALVMGLARVAAGIHWPSDVLGAILLGGLVVIGLRAYCRL
jgi:undecaprenyl-diphosphatase